LTVNGNFRQNQFIQGNSKSFTFCLAAVVAEAVLAVYALLVMVRKLLK